MTAKSKKRFTTAIVYLLLIAGSVLCLMPLFWMLRSSLMTNVENFHGTYPVASGSFSVGELSGRL